MYLYHMEPSYEKLTCLHLQYSTLKLKIQQINKLIKLYKLKGNLTDM